MKGDFSKWGFDPKKSFDGVLHQQGRVLLDSDWNDQTRIALNWQDHNARDIIGARVAAVPASEREGFKVLEAEITEVDGTGTLQVELRITPGRIWADGLLVCLPGEEPDLTADVQRIATHLLPPIQDADFDRSSDGTEVRDVVVLEVWREAINGFQLPLDLIEPALGGPDTTERVHLAMAFRLFRLAPGEDCKSIRDRLKDDFSQKGKLTVSLQPTNVIPGDCPVVEEGGYTGFEHYLYRIEIAEVESGTHMFKWSQFNGGLVGRGIFDATLGEEKISITANMQPIVTSGLTEFYMEAVLYNEELGCWKVTYGAKVTLNSDHELDISTVMFGIMPTSTNSVFFRLWNDIHEISDFPIGPDPVELRDGIRLALEPAIDANYKPGDYWTFEVRAGEINNSEILIDAKPPEGIHYHRVPLAELHYDDDRSATFEEGQIEDCRDIFQPLTNQKGCCTFCVGDGVRSHGDFNSIEEALRHLPISGGEICLLPGIHESNTRIIGKRNIRIKGCDKKTLVIPREENREDPIFHIIDSECIVLEHMDMVSLGGTPILMEATQLGTLREIEICYNRLLAGEHAIFVHQGQQIHIHYNLIRMLDKEDAKVAIYLFGEESTIERNRIGVVSAVEFPPPDDNIPEGPRYDPNDPCADPERVYNNPLFLGIYLRFFWNVNIFFIPSNPFKALGGIQIAGGSEQIKVQENAITGGAGNGITLGGWLSPLSKDMAEEEDGEEEEHNIIEQYGGGVEAQVIMDGTPISGVPLLFTNQNGQDYMSKSDGSGYIRTLFDEDDDKQGPIFARTVDTRLFLEGISQGSNGPHEIIVTARGKEPEVDQIQDHLAFIYEIQIEKNEVSEMGLSGIGTPLVSIAKGANPIEHLKISDNYIFNCWNNPLDSTFKGKEFISSHGVGGISLQFCENVVILENRIENNGTDQFKPTCGIFVAHGVDVNVSHNRIVNNGPITESYQEMQEGPRGGIVMQINSFSPPEVLSGSSYQIGASATNAACIHHNLVDQPAGLALFLKARGPLSILGNQFNSELSDPGSIAGAVLIYNLARVIYNLPPSPINSAGDLAPSEDSFVDLASWNSGYRADTKLGLDELSGRTLFNNNQTRVGIHNDCQATQVIFTLDDLGFDDNQSYNHQKKSPLSNTMLGAVTLRASDNRFRDISSSPPFSLITIAQLLNNTTNNQLDYCVLALSLSSRVNPQSLLDNGNQILFDNQCDKLEPVKLIFLNNK